ncbi:hypothetical protein ACU3L3_07005 [Priestia endophytica]
MVQIGDKIQCLSGRHFLTRTYTDNKNTIGSIGEVVAKYGRNFAVEYPTGETLHHQYINEDDTWKYAKEENK